MKKLNGTIIKIFAVLLSAGLLCFLPAGLSILTPAPASPFFLIFESAAAEGRQVLTLQDGFNFVAVTLTPRSNLADILTANRSIKEIYSYSPAAGSFLSASAGEISSLVPGRGYIVRSEGAADIVFTGEEKPLTGDINLKAGFNLVGFSSQPELLKFSELISAHQSIKGVYKWSCAAGSFLTVLRINGRPAAIDGTDPGFTAAQSYFFNMESGAVLNYDTGKIILSTDAPPIPPEPPKPPEPQKPVLTSIEADRNNISLAAGARYDLSQIKITAIFSDKSTKEVAAAYTCQAGAITQNSYQAPETPGEVYINVSYSENGVSADYIIKFIIIKTHEIDIADYFPMRPADLYNYSTGSSVIDYKIVGNYYAAGVLATKFGSSDGSYDYYRLDNTGLYYCGLFDDKPQMLSSKYPEINDSWVSYVKSPAGNITYTTRLAAREAYQVRAGVFTDVLLIECKSLLNGYESTSYYFLAKNIGLIRYATNYKHFELVSGLIGGTAYAPEKKKWTFLIYSCGDNDSGDISSVLINEIKGYRNTDIEKDANIAVQLSPSKYYYGDILSEFYNISAARFYLMDGVFYRVNSLIGEHTNNGDPEDISSFLEWGVNTFPAERYAVFISAHGSGIISLTGLKAPASGRSIAYDDHPYDYLSAYEYKNIFNALKLKIGRKIDIITFDSCVMGMLEVAYQLKECADYFVASEAVALERDTALFTKKFMALADKSPAAVSKTIVDSYIESPKLAGSSITMSAIDLSKISQMEGYINSIASLWLLKMLNETEIRAFVNAIYDARRFGPSPYNESTATILYDFSTSYIDLFDFASMLSQNSGPGNLKNCADLILNHKSALVAHNRATGSYYPRANGLTIFIPKFSMQWYNNGVTSNYIREQYLYLTEFGKLTKWGAFLDEWATLLYKNGY
jgi:hypothetical protein